MELNQDYVLTVEDPETSKFELLLVEALSLAEVLSLSKISQRCCCDIHEKILYREEMSYLPVELQLTIASYLPLVEKYRQGRDNPNIYQSILDDYADLLVKYQELLVKETTIPPSIAPIQQNGNMYVGLYATKGRLASNERLEIQGQLDTFLEEIVKQDDVEIWKDLQRFKPNIDIISQAFVIGLTNGSCAILKSILHNQPKNYLLTYDKMDVIMSIARYSCVSDLLLQPKYRSDIIRALELLSTSPIENMAIKPITSVIQKLIQSGTNPRYLRSIIVDIQKAVNEEMENARLASFMQSRFSPNLYGRQSSPQTTNIQELIDVHDYLSLLL